MPFPLNQDIAFSFNFIEIAFLDLKAVCETSTLFSRFTAMPCAFTGSMKQTTPKLPTLSDLNEPNRSIAVARCTENVGVNLTQC